MEALLKTLLLFVVDYTLGLEGKKRVGSFGMLLLSLGRIGEESKDMEHWIELGKIDMQIVDFLLVLVLLVDWALDWSEKRENWNGFLEGIAAIKKVVGWVGQME